MAFNLRNLAVDPITEPCPSSPRNESAGYFAQQGYTANFTGFAVDTYYATTSARATQGSTASPTSTAPSSRIRRRRTTRPSAPRTSRGITFQDFLTGFEGQTLLTPSVPGIGGEVGGVCIPSFCYLHWHRGAR